MEKVKVGYGKYRYEVAGDWMKEKRRYKGWGNVPAPHKDFYQVPLLGIVPCYCDVLRAKGDIIFVQDQPDHPFTKVLDEMVRKIETGQV